MTDAFRGQASPLDTEGDRVVYGTPNDPTPFTVRIHCVSCDRFIPVLDHLAENIDMVNLLDAVESRGLPAPAPVEQRWTCGSPSAMSPVAGGPSDLFSWVGIVMYVPDSDSPKKVEQVRDAFNTYASLLTEELAPRYNAAEHWAKIMPSSRFGVSVKRKELECRFPIAERQAARSMLDPKGILSNGLLTDLIPHHNKTLASRFSAL